MKPRLVILFAALVLAPLAGLGWLGLRIAREEQDIVRHRFDDVLAEQLGAVDAQVARTVERWERELGRVTAFPSLDPAALREVPRTARGVRQAFVVDPDGRLAFPGDDPTPAEQAFLARTESIWDAREPFWRPSDAGPAPSARTAPADREQGWHAWFHGSGLNLIFWRRDAGTGRVLGVEVDRVALLADVIADLPDTAIDDPGTARVRLVDGNGTEVYAWGLRDPADGEPPRATRPLDPPLASLRLESFPDVADLDRALGGGTALGLGAGLAALVLAVLGLAAWVVREGGREIRDARQRVTFVNEVSHELKTPLTNIRMYAELLQDRLEGDDPALVDHARVIVDESERLSRLIANVLSLARQGRGKLAVRRTPAVVDDVVEGVLARFRPSLEALGIRPTFTPGAPATVAVDADALGQILGNLLSNVEKYAAAGGRVDIATSRAGDDVFVEVADAGPGVPESARGKVFEAFWRGSRKVVDGVAGTGIGLTIARDLARLHGGDVVLLPSPAGARFQVRLSCRVPEGDA